MLFLELKTYLTPFSNSLNCQSDLSQFFFLYMITIVLSLCWRRKQHCYLIRFSFSSWCSCETRSVYSKRSSSAKTAATTPAIVDYRNRACLYHLGHLWLKLSAVHAFYLQLWFRFSLFSPLGVASKHAAHDYQKCACALLFYLLLSRATSLSCGAQIAEYPNINADCPQFLNGFQLLRCWK